MLNKHFSEVESGIPDTNKPLRSPGPHNHPVLKFVGESFRYLDLSNAVMVARQMVE
jgi:hypothetical protein